MEYLATLSKKLSRLQAVQVVEVVVARLLPTIMSQAMAS
jgi:hypothetical protein